MNDRTEKPKLVIFDLGNVVIRIDWQPMFDIWSKASGVPAKDLQLRFQFDENYEGFERGQLTARDYHACVCRLLGAVIPYPKFLEGWNAIFQDTVQGIGELLTQLKDKVRVVAFTNSNEVHHQVWRKKYEDVLTHFHHIFISSEMGLRKPDAESFKHILSHFAMEPRETLFFDDLLPNVDAARRLGIHAVLVESLESVRSTLTRLWFLD
ncbi:MAG: HAD-IA family hydrolase [Proteobacteria bacterium]|nr:HAD-IA family hydrolase [Pseudomonadota bacterium]MBU4471171.1 HAD-IA family hydrolase [Pseudomonadota bacterium]MCG2753146.1 HAD-IA family hydrolase [Desulfobacteraceae bacterium]